MTALAVSQHGMSPVLPSSIVNPAMLTISPEELLEMFDFTPTPRSKLTYGSKRYHYPPCCRCQRPYANGQYEPCGVCNAVDQMLKRKDQAQ